MEVRMLFYSVEEIKLIVASRAPVDDTIAIAVDVDTDNEMLELKLIFRFWPKYKTYIAYPVSLIPTAVRLLRYQCPMPGFGT